ncbi:thiopeptide-type bacteriocin biosynthesis protein [Streptomyces sp. NPDC056716]|uniref:thiopeptide-type bacteriocin biosynthesis protein n=1 Tax=unclassified Streptomyces TaxID=2593676 RepID=UPI003686A1F2
MKAPSPPGSSSASVRAGACATWPPPPGHDRLGQDLDALITGGAVTASAEIVYEPETHAFGGPGAMASAHRLFHRDSRNLTHFLRGYAGRHRRETSLMLCSLMMRSAGLDWYEQGDVWAKVGAHRALPDGHRRALRDGSGQGGEERLLAAVRRLISVNGEDLMRVDGPMADRAQWADAYSKAGRELADLADTGRLHRGLRDVLAHHVLFAWNRIGLPYDAQAALAAAAKAVVFGPDLMEGRSAADHVDTA